jgi:hypothetical protein
MLPVGFKPTISAGERPQTHDLDRAATGNSTKYFTQSQQRELLLYRLAEQSQLDTQAGAFVCRQQYETK